MNTNHNNAKSQNTPHVARQCLGRGRVCVALFMAIVFCTGLLSADEKDPPKTKGRILLVTGEDYPGHKWKMTTLILHTQIEKDPRLKIEVLKDLKRLPSTRLSDYDAVILHFKNYDPKVPGRSGFDNLDKYVNSGGALVLVHFACGAFQEFKTDYQKLVGRVWNPKLRGHDPYGKFRIDIATGDHPVTRGMKAFETNDELYTCLEGKTPITVLASAVSKVDGKTHPLAFVLTIGQGRVFHCVLGHDVQALKNNGTGQLFRQGTAWAAGLDSAK